MCSHHTKYRYKLRTCWTLHSIIHCKTISQTILQVLWIIHSSRTNWFGGLSVGTPCWQFDTPSLSYLSAQTVHRWLHPCILSTSGDYRSGFCCDNTEADHLIDALSRKGIRRCHKCGSPGADYEPHQQLGRTTMFWSNAFLMLKLEDKLLLRRAELSQRTDGEGACWEDIFRSRKRQCLVSWFLIHVLPSGPVWAETIIALKC